MYFSSGTMLYDVTHRDLRPVPHEWDSLTTLCANGSPVILIEDVYLPSFYFKKPLEVWQYKSFNFDIWWTKTTLEGWNFIITIWLDSSVLKNRDFHRGRPRWWRYAINGSILSTSSILYFLVQPANTGGKLNCHSPHRGFVLAYHCFIWLQNIRE